MTKNKNVREDVKNKDIRIAYLEKVCQWDLFFLDLIASMGDLYGNDFLNRDVDAIYSLTKRHLKRFMDFNTIAFFNVDESDSSFILKNCEPESKQEMMQKTVDYLIEDGTFAWALSQNRPVVVKKNPFGTPLILHVLSTKMRVRGMFVGVLAGKKPDLIDTQLHPLSIALHYTANAIESTVLYKIISDHNQNLQEIVRKRTQELEDQTENLKQEVKERKQAEKELIKYRNHLEELVEERTAELKSTHEQLLHAEKFSAIGKLSASIAHELNNPITGIQSVLERIDRKVPMDETNKDLVDVAIRECRRITDLIKKLQDFHRPSPGIIAPMDIHQVLDEVLLLSQVKLRMRGIEVEKNYASNIPEIQAISDQIKQVILNMINNAEEAISADGGKLKIITGVFDSKIKIHIQDTGCGIPPENVKSIFDPFFTTKSAAKGTGLGLSISYGIIKQHGGEIEVESEPGKGTTFTITLPIKLKIVN